MTLDNFASRGLKAQTAVDELAAMYESNDAVGLRRIAADPDKPLGARMAAERRLRILARRKKTK